MSQVTEIDIDAPVNCNEPESSEICVSVPFAQFGFVDVASVSVIDNLSNPPGFETSFLMGGYTKLLFTIDRTNSTSATITFDTDNVNEVTLQINLQNVQTINSGNTVVTGDCGDGGGVIELFSEADLGQYNQAWLLGNGLFIQLLELNQGLFAGDYTIFASGGFCPPNFTVTVPDSSIDIVLSEQTDLVQCVDELGAPSGSIGAQVTGLINGGSGSYDYTLLGSSFILDIVGFDFTLSEISNAGFLQLQVIDTQTQCADNVQIAIVEDELEFTLSLVGTTPIVATAGCSFYQDGGSIEVEASSSDYDIEYSWSPNGGISDGAGLYSSITTTGLYSVTANVAGASCFAELDVDITAEVCEYYGDMNNDGVVNMSDLSIFFGSQSHPFPVNSELGLYVDPCSILDINQDGVFTVSDVSSFLSMFGTNIFSWCD